ncbi:MAG TPA: sugar phosphate nucleotidyltransferase [Thermomicrobiales bacterium]|nr:sugar phosphate nucleotidyltransferase [Thermomicrobiales bacterium]
MVECTGAAGVGSPVGAAIERREATEERVDIILPVAGLGTRLRPQTWTKPKPLVAVAGKPMLAHVLDRVLPLQPERLIFITGFLGDQIEAWARATYDLPVEFVVQPEMKGQTDAIIRTRGLAPDDALILFPDMLFEADFSVLDGIAADVVMFTKEVEDPSALGIALVEEGRIVKLIEKPKEPISKLAVIGIYYIKRMAALYAAIEEQMQRGLSLKNEYFIADAIQLMIDGGAHVVAAPVTEWEDCGNIETLLATNRYLLEREPPPVVERAGSAIIQPSFVAADATIEQAVVGPFASIGPGAVVRSAVVRDAILDEGAQVEAAIVEHSVLGRRAQVCGHARRVNAGDDATLLL